jgi:hypothetical protein
LLTIPDSCVSLVRGRGKRINIARKMQHRYYLYINRPRQNIICIENGARMQEPLPQRSSILAGNMLKMFIFLFLHLLQLLVVSERMENNKYFFFVCKFSKC